MSAEESPITIRIAEPEDWVFVRDLGRTVTPASRSSLRTASELALYVSYDRLLRYAYSASHVLAIAEVDGQRAGFLLLLDQLPDEVTGSPQGFVAYMAVAETYRRRGIGERLLHYAEEETRARGISHLALMVTEENAPARRLYERLGFVTERRLLCKQL